MIGGGFALSLGLEKYFLLSLFLLELYLNFKKFHFSLFKTVRRLFKGSIYDFKYSIKHEIQQLSSVQCTKTNLPYLP